MPSILYYLFSFLIVYMFDFKEGDTPVGLTYPLGDQTGKDRGHHSSVSAPIVD